MKILIGCETSGTVRNAFLALGHDTWSCDVLPSDDKSNRHIQDDIRNVMKMDNWDFMAVMHPPCTRLTNSGARWLKEPPTNPPADCTPEEAELWPHLSEEDKLTMIWSHLDKGAELFSDCWNADIPKVVIENPVMHKHAKERIRNYEPFAQSVHPWQFAKDDASVDNEKKRTCLWIRGGLKKLIPTGPLDGSTARSSVHHASPGKDRWKIRSKFFQGMADAMALQWGGLAA